MRSPSARILFNTVDIYAGVAGRGSDGEPTFTYPTLTKSQMPCSVQFIGADEVIDDQQRLTVLNRYKIYFKVNPAISPRDMIVWVDRADGTHTMFVEAVTDEAGRGLVFKVMAVERQ